MGLKLDHRMLHHHNEPVEHHKLPAINPSIREEEHTVIIMVIMFRFGMVIYIVDPDFKFGLEDMTWQVLVTVEMETGKLLLVKVGTIIEADMTIVVGIVIITSFIIVKFTRNFGSVIQTPLLGQIVTFSLLHHYWCISLGLKRLMDCQRVINIIRRFTSEHLNCQTVINIPYMSLFQKCLMANIIVLIQVCIIMNQREELVGISLLALMKVVQEVVDYMFTNHN